MPYYYDDDDGGDDGYRPRRPRMHSNYTGGHLNPDGYARDGGLHRSRSQGQRPAPEIHIINEMFQQENQQARPPRGRADARSQQNFYYPPPPPPVPAFAPQPVPPQFVQVPMLPVAHSRSRSRSRSDVDRRRSDEYYLEKARMEAWEAQKRAEEFEKKNLEKVRQEALEAQRRAEENDKKRKEAIFDYQRKQDEAERERKKEMEEFSIQQKLAAEKKRAADEEAIRKHERKVEEEEQQRKEAEAEAVRKFQQRLDKEKKEKEEIEKETVRRYFQQQEEKKKKEKEEEEEWERRRKAKAAEEAAKKEKEEEEYKERVRRDLAKFGLRENQIDTIVNYDEKKKKNESALASRPVADRLLGGRPVFPKIRRVDIAVETLEFYNLPWEHDRQDDKYIIILQELSERETDILFEHTRRARSKTTLTIQDRGKDKPEYAWVRRRSKSRGKSPSRRERFAEAVVGLR